jgi:hypothetical protein
VEAHTRKRLVLGHLQFYGRQVKDLAALLTYDGGFLQGEAAGGAGLRSMHESMVGMLH